MAIRIVRVHRPTGYNGNIHEAIADLQWVNEESGTTGVSTRETVYEWLMAGGKAFVRDAARDVAYVETRITARGTKYLQTYADGIWKDNLLALPTF